MQIRGVQKKLNPSLSAVEETERERETRKLHRSVPSLFLFVFLFLLLTYMFPFENLEVYKKAFASHQKVINYLFQILRSQVILKINMAGQV